MVHAAGSLGALVASSPKGSTIYSMDGLVVPADKNCPVATAPSRSALDRVQELLHCTLEDNSARVEQLLVQGAYADTRNDKGETLLYLAAERGHLDVVRSLIKFGADVKFRNEADEGNTALHTACLNGHIETALYIIDSGAEMDALNDDLRTPLHHAAAEGRRLLCNCLIGRGCDIRARDKDGLSPIDLMNCSGMPIDVQINVGNLPLTDGSHRDLWRTHTGHGRCTNEIEDGVDVDVMRRIVREAENFGMPMTESDVDRIMSRVRPREGRITYTQFSQLMLVLAQR